MAGRLVVVLTSHRVAPGLLTVGAWDALRAADVVAAPEGHPQAPYLAEAGVVRTDVPAQARSPVDALAGWLLDRADEGGGRTVAWLAGAADGDELNDALARRVVTGAPGAPGDGADVVVEVVPGSYDLPGGRLLDLVAVMDRLRAECPWDGRQTHASLAPYLIEEAYETVETIEAGDLVGLREELGDVLLQVVFHSRVAAERTDDTAFTVDDVAAGIVDKMIRRHPHVFADVAVDGADQVTANWDEIKAAERAAKHGEDASALDGVPMSQPALALATALQRRAVRAGLPADLIPMPGEGLGPHLFTLLTQVADEDPESALRATARTFRENFRKAESTTPKTPEQWQAAWPQSGSPPDSKP